MNFKNLSTNDDIVKLSPKHADSERIEREIEKFLAAGGKIQQCDSGTNYEAKSDRFSLQFSENGREPK